MTVYGEEVLPFPSAMILIEGQKNTSCFLFLRMPILGYHCQTLCVCHPQSYGILFFLFLLLLCILFKFVMIKRIFLLIYVEISHPMYSNHHHVIPVGMYFAIGVIFILFLYGPLQRFKFHVFVVKFPSRNAPERVAC